VNLSARETPNVHEIWHVIKTDVLTHVSMPVVRVPSVMLFKDVPGAHAHNTTKAIHRADAILNAQLTMTARHTKPATSFSASTLVMELVVQVPSARLKTTNLSASAQRDTPDIHLRHADHSPLRTCAVTTHAVIALTVPQALTAMVTIARSAHVHVASLVTPLSPVREENANNTATAVIIRLATLTHARILVTLTWALFVVIMPSVM